MKVAHIHPPAFSVIARSSSYMMKLGQVLLRDETALKVAQLQMQRGAFIMLDNGAAERDTPPFENILWVAETINADEVVLPDKLGDKEFTIHAHTVAADKVPIRRRIIIPQGQDFEEWKQCFKAIHTMLDKSYRTIGIAKHMEDKVDGGRPAIVKWLMENYYAYYYDIHFFGFCGDPIAELNAARATYEGIRGVDSGAAVAWAQHDRFVDDGGPRCSLEWWPNKSKSNPIPQKIQIAIENARLLNEEAFNVG